MLSSLAANAILAKSRAKFGHRLTKQQYADLLACHSVTEIASYLKAHTKYADGMKGYSAETLHRGGLESCLRQYLFEEYASLYRLEHSLRDRFYPYFILKGDLQQILSCLRFILGGTPEEYLFQLPDYFNKHTELDLYRLAEAKTFRQLLEALEHTPYHAVLKYFERFPEEQLDFSQIDSALQHHMVSSIRALIEKGFRGKSKQEMLDLLGIQCDLINLSYLYRLRHILLLPDFYVRSMLLPHGKFLGEKQITRLLEEKTAEGFLKQVEGLSLYRYFPQVGQEYFEYFTKGVLYRYSSKNLHYSPDPPVVLYSYILLAEMEVANIIHIIEGIRYQIPTEEIASLLIGLGTEKV